METCIESPLRDEDFIILNVRVVSDDIEMEILREVCLICCVMQSDVQLPNKGKREVCDARHIAVTLIQKYTTLSYTKIGMLLGGRDHSTISASLNTTRALCESEKAFKQKFIDCDKAIKLKYYL